MLLAGVLLGGAILPLASHAHPAKSTVCAYRYHSLPPVHEYYHYAREPYAGWRPTIRLVREAIYGLPNGYRNVTINGVQYYTYDFGPYRGRYFRALGQTDEVMNIVPP